LDLKIQLLILCNKISFFLYSPIKAKNSTIVYRKISVLFTGLYYGGLSLNSEILLVRIGIDFMQESQNPHLLLLLKLSLIASSSNRKIAFRGNYTFLRISYPNFLSKMKYILNILNYLRKKYHMHYFWIKFIYFRLESNF
jgi:hypothetical protein